MPHGLKNAVKLGPGALLMVTQLLEGGHDPNAWEVESALHLAADQTHTAAAQVVALLLERGAVADSIDSKGDTALHRAVRKSCRCVGEAAEVARMTIRTLIAGGASVDARTKRRDTSICICFYCLSVKTLQLLIELGADVHAPGNWDWKPLRIAVNKPSRAFMVEALVNAGAASSFAPAVVCDMQMGYTLLHIAVKELNSSGSGESVRQRRRASEKAILALCSAGLDPRAHSKFGETSAHIAARLGNTSAIKALVAGGRPLHEYPLDRVGGVPLHDAAGAGALEVCKLLLSQCPAWVAVKNNRAETPLHKAAKCSEAEKGIAGAEVIALLITAGAPLSARDSNGLTPLHVAASHGLYWSVRALLLNDGDAAAAALEDGQGKTPLAAAEVKGHVAVARLLREHAANGASPMRSMATTRFIANYRARQEPPRFQDELMLAIRSIIIAYFAKHSLHYEEGISFFRVLEGMLFPEIHQGLMEQMAKKAWISSARAASSHGELCSVLNDLVRSDDEDAMPHVAVFVRALNQLCVVRAALADVPFPANGVCYRGGGFNDEFRAFFVVGAVYRVPGLLATSFSLDVAEGFAQRGAITTTSKIIWTIQLDPRGQDQPQHRCAHANLIQNEGELEYLFVPYSAFKVIDVSWQGEPPAHGGDGGTHYITIQAFSDNLDAPEDAALAPWY
mmetsp:Transcript_11551/g.37945  ORF Transcript_11551/g.37945 Transcript_11551/m.37945 type:complete len:679 (-) Transcript_11551:76-2112(-)